MGRGRVLKGLPPPQGGDGDPQPTDTPLAGEPSETSQERVGGCEAETREGATHLCLLGGGVGGNWRGHRARQGPTGSGAGKVAAGPQGGRCLVLTPFNTSSRWSRNCINRLIFQLVLQFTELTWRGGERPIMLGRPPAL